MTVTASKSDKILAQLCALSSAPNDVNVLAGRNMDTYAHFRAAWERQGDTFRLAVNGSEWPRHWVNLVLTTLFPNADLDAVLPIGELR